MWPGKWRTWPRDRLLFTMDITSRKLASSYHTAHGVRGQRSDVKLACAVTQCAAPMLCFVITQRVVIIIIIQHSIRSLFLFGLLLNLFVELRILTWKKKKKIKKIKKRKRGRFGCLFVCWFLCLFVWVCFVAMAFIYRSLSSFFFFLYWCFVFIILFLIFARGRHPKKNINIYTAVH